MIPHLTEDACCGIEITFETIMSVYESQALDPHVNRERFREEWLE